MPTLGILDYSFELDGLTAIGPNMTDAPSRAL